MLRAAALSLLILVTVAVTLPLVDSSAHNSGRSTSSRRHHMGRRHSRAWWRRYRARLRRQRTEQKRKQALKAVRGQSLNAAADSHNNAVSPAKLSTPIIGKLSAPSSSGPQNPAAALSLPNGWSRRGAANGESKFVVNASDGQYVGAATLSLVNAHASGETIMSARANRSMLGGVPLTELRRTVIDKMVLSNGWVVNDLQREIGGKPVFIVLAQTAASSDGRTPQLFWAFYFTEVEGRIYGLAASSLMEFSDRITNESAQFISSFHVNSRSASTETSQR